jgi:D-sedoheptulose 7-phosphate isomerase
MTIEQAFSEHARVMADASRALPAVISTVADTIHACLRHGNSILACGNGGSAADAEHFVAELVGRFRRAREALSAVALTASGPLVTALSNDYGYDRVFARQVEALARAGDVLLAISTSGNSANVIEAARAARARTCTVVALTGREGGRLAAEADIVVLAPSIVVSRIQEVHGFCIHAIVEALEARLSRGGI